MMMIDVWDSKVRSITRHSPFSSKHPDPGYLPDWLVAMDEIQEAAIYAVESYGGAMNESGWYPADEDFEALVDDLLAKYGGVNVEQDER